MSNSRWHRQVSPVFFALLVFAGLWLGVLAYVLLSAVLQAH